MPIRVEFGPADDGVDARGYDIVTVEVLGSLLRGGTFEEVEADPRYLGDPAAPGGQASPDDATEDNPVVVTVTDGLLSAVAELTDAEIDAAVARWMQTEELQMPGWDEQTPEGHADLVRKLPTVAAAD